MRLVVLPSAHGDCLLLESLNRRMLIDGGIDDSFRTRVLPELARTNEAPIDCVYLSHIDFDHIGGLLVLVDALYAWRVHDYRKGKGHDVEEPQFLQPPEVLKVWHNAFTAQLKENAAIVADALANTAAILSGLNAADAALEEIRIHHQDLATHTGHALELTNRIGAGQLGIDVNPEYEGGLMVFREDEPQPELRLGDVTFTLLGPTAADLRKLRDEWDAWLRKNKDAVRQIRRTSRVEADELLSSSDSFVAPLEMEARLLAQSLAASAEELGLRRKVTAPNLASLMFLAEEGKQKVLLTGDGHADDILAGLEKRKKLTGKGTLHVDVLKVQHHGAEYNMTPDFAKRVTADHYVFCGNGHSNNPEEVVLETIAAARPKGKYKFWFNSTSANSPYADHMKLVEKRVKQFKVKSKGRLSYEFRDEPFAIPIARSGVRRRPLTPRKKT